MDRGYVRLWRKTLDSGLLHNGPAWQLFGYLMLKATHKPATCIVSGQVVQLSPGQTVFGRVKAAANLDLSERNIRTALKLLEKMQIVTSKATNKFTIITFVNWDVYQCERPADDQQSGKQTTSMRPACDHIQEQENKTKNINTPPLPPKGGSEGAASADVSPAREEPKEDPKPKRERQRFAKPTPDEVNAYCAGRGNGIDGEEFCDFYEARGWVVGKSPMKDWRAAVRTWENSRRNGGARASPAVKSWAEQRADKIEADFLAGRI